MKPILVVTFALALLLHAEAHSQPFRFNAIERRDDVIALVADAHTGKVLGGVRMSESRSLAYHPASVFKLAIVIAALDGKARVDVERVCHGVDTIGGCSYRCWLPAGHGHLGLIDAIAHSCNLYFRQLARSVSHASIESSARALGLYPIDSSSPISDTTLLGEASTVTPSMMLQTALTLASRGRLAHPTMSLSNARYDPMYRGLAECVRTGTAHAAWSRKISISGKTGTTEANDAPGHRIGWFIGFAPSRNPSYAIVVLHRDGIGSDAAAIAREMLESIL